MQVLGKFAKIKEKKEKKRKKKEKKKKELLNQILLLGNSAPSICRLSIC
jgi:hypothetical protein